MAPTSSTKKAAKLTQRGKGKSVRFQGGTLFPFIVALVVVLGIGTVVYARQSQPAADASPPTINDHWHAAYGFYICGQWFQLDGDLEERNAQGQFTNVDFLRTGVHSHNDGVIHWHPYTSAAVGRRATIGLFLDVYGVDLDDDRLAFPDNQTIGEWGAGAEFVSGETECNGEVGELSTVVWGSYLDTGSGTRYIANHRNIRIQTNSMVFAVAFVPRGEAVPMPPWAPQLPELGAIDITGVTPQELIDQNLLPEDFDESIFPQTTDATGDEPTSTAPDATSPDATNPDATNPDEGTAPDATTAPTTPDDDAPVTTDGSGDDDASDG